MEINLDEYLTRQRAEGSFESGGEFKISAEQAARKLARFALPEAYSWVQKLLQALAGWKVPSLQVRQSKAATFFHFVPPNDRDYPAKEDLLQTLISTEIGGRAPLQRLCIALRSLVEQGGLAFVYGVELGEGDSYSIYAGADTGSMDKETRESWGRLSERGMVLVVSHQTEGESFTGRFLPGFLLRERRGVSIAQALEKCGVCLPMPVILEGRVLNDIWSHSELGFSKYQRPLLMTGRASKDSESVFRRSFPKTKVSFFQRQASARSRASTLESASSWLLFRVREVGHSGSTSRDVPPPAADYAVPPSEILWVQDGVVVSRQELGPFCWVCQFYLFVNADGLRTDLTGLELVESSERAARLEDALLGMRSALKEMRDDTGWFFEEGTELNKQSFREEYRAEVLESLPPALGRFRRWASVLGGGPNERRGVPCLTTYRNLLDIDLRQIGVWLRNQEAANRPEETS